MRLISERIEVELSEESGGLREPITFTWRGRRYVIQRILRVWPEIGFGAGERTRVWYRRRHRNHYRVETDTGEIFELYLDRAGSRREWILAKALSSRRQTDEEQKSAPPRYREMADL